MKAVAPAALAILALGILSLFLIAVPVVGAVPGLVAIGLYSAKRGQHERSGEQAFEGPAVAGLVCGIIGAVGSSLVALVYLVVLASGIGGR